MGDIQSFKCVKCFLNLGPGLTNLLGVEVATPPCKKSSYPPPELEIEVVVEALSSKHDPDQILLGGPTVQNPRVPRP